MPDSQRGVQRNPAIMCDFGFGFWEKTGIGSKLVPFNLRTSSSPQFYHQFENEKCLSPAVPPAISCTSKEWLTEQGQKYMSNRQAPGAGTCLQTRMRGASASDLGFNGLHAG
ncbi:MAG: hypothetical protein WCK17_07520 [Verrucomicrobiota bacterium]